MKATMRRLVVLMKQDTLHTLAPKKRPPLPYSLGEPEKAVDLREHNQVVLGLMLMCLFSGIAMGLIGSILVRIL